MSTPEQPPAPYRPSTTATLGAAGDSSLAAAHAAVTPTLVAAGVQARAIAGASEQIVEALGRFAQSRQSTIIPMLQSSLLETFVHRTPDEIAKLLGKEQARERVFLRRQASRIKRDLPKVLSEADAEKRRTAMGKLLAREKRYMAQREQAMAARAHSLVESLDLQDASPEGAYWQLGHATHHTPGCVAMAGKFWPWSVLREVTAPPVHPGCACRLLGLHEAIAKGLMTLGAPLPDPKDAALRARRYMALEEELLSEVSDEDAMVLIEAQKRFPKGDVHGGEFMPQHGASFKKAKGAVKKLLAQRGEDRGMWLRGHRVTIPHAKKWQANFVDKGQQTIYSSPPESTNVYRRTYKQGAGGLSEPQLVSTPGEPDTHPDLLPPGDQPAAKLTPPGDLPADLSGPLAQAHKDMVAQVTKRLEQPKQGPPVSIGQSGASAHEALKQAGFVVRPKYSNAGKGELRMAYISKAGHELSVQTSRKSGKIVDVAWKPDLQAGGLFPNEWKTFQAGEEPQGFGAPPQAGKGGAKPVLGVPGGLFGGKGSGGHTSGAPKAPSGWKPAPPPPPIEHPALLKKPAKPAPGALPNFDHVPLTQKHGTQSAQGPGDQRFALRAHGGDQDRVASELLANEIYRKLGAAVPDAGVRHLHDPTPDFASIPDANLSETPIDAKPGQRISSGIIIRDAKGNVTLFEPKNHFGGYEHTFPKGGVERGLTPQQNAHKELWEETGLHAQITGLVGDYQGDTSVSRYYTGVLTGGTPTPGDETWAVKTVPPDEAAKLLNKERDQQILADVLQHPAPTGKPPADAFPTPVGDRAALLAPQVEGAKLERVKGPHAEMAKHFMADALLANWEFLGKHGDEVLTGPDGKPIRHDHSGALGFRMSGQEKPFGPVPTEVWTLAGPRGQGFGRIQVTDAQKRRQAAAIAKALPPQVIDDLVAAAPFRDEAMRNELRNSLHQRVQWMGRYAKGQEAEPEALTGGDAAGELTSMQAGLELFPEQHAALDSFADHSHDVNAHLVSGAPKEHGSQETNFVIRELDGLLRHVQTDEDITATMPLDVSLLPEGDIVGKTLNHRGYLQLALHPDETAKATMRVLLPAGAHALYTRGIEGADTPQNQADVIAARGARLRIVRKTTKSGRVTVEAVLL